MLAQLWKGAGPRWAFTGHLLALLTMSTMGTSVHEASAVCDAIPGVSQTFRGTLGSADRPFAGPGDFVELRLSAACDKVSEGEPRRFADCAEDHVVTVIFKPPHGPRNLVVLGADCTAMDAPLCSGRTDVAEVCCVEAAPVTTTEAGELVAECQNTPRVESTRFTSPIGLELRVMKTGERRLRFRFPDTDGRLGTADDDRTLAGPAALAVTAVGDPLPRQLAAEPCASAPGLLACVDRLFEMDGTCGTVAHPTFSHFTALPPPNNFQALCYEPSPPCNPTAPEVRFTIDADGNVLIPMDWLGVLVGPDIPVARLLRASTSVEAFPGGGQPIRIPSKAFLNSFTPKGGPLAPIFDPQADPTAANEVTLFGTADAPQGVLRIARRSPTLQACDGGDNDGLPCTFAEDCPGPPATTCDTSLCVGGSNSGDVCTEDVDCLGGECGPSLFDFATRLTADIGPILITRLESGVCQGGENAGKPCTNSTQCPGNVCVSYRLEAQNPVQLDGLIVTDSLTAFIVHEAITATDLNGDSDSTDDVLILADRRTGARQHIGTEILGDRAVGRATVRIHQRPFTFPAVVAEGDVVAFLQPEPAQHHADATRDGDFIDTILKVFRLGGGEVATRVQELGVDAAPVLNGRSLVIARQFLFFRTWEASTAQQHVERISVASDGTEADNSSLGPDISGDGRYVTFWSNATNLTPDHYITSTPPYDFLLIHPLSEVFIHDRSAKSTHSLQGTTIFSATRAAAISNDGSTVGYVSTNLPYPLSPVTVRVFAYDTSIGAVTSIARSEYPHDGYGGDFADVAPSISDDGRFIAFMSAASDVVPADTNSISDSFVVDRLVGTIQRVNVYSYGTEAFTAGGHFPSISGDGRYVSFDSSTSPENVSNVFVHDRYGGVTERVDVDSLGNAGDGYSRLSNISGDGRYVAFESSSTNLVPGDSNGSVDVFVHDRVTQITERVSVGSAGEQGNRDSYGPRITANGRYVVFGSEASTLVPGDGNISSDVFIRDRLTGLTDRISVSPFGNEGNGASGLVWPGAAISDDGRYVAFSSSASNLVTGDANECGDSGAGSCVDVFVRGPDDEDVAADLTQNRRVGETVLQALQLETGEIVTICPADVVAIAERATEPRAAFLRPEDAGGAVGCPADLPSLNGDSDTLDSVVHLWLPSTGAVNLRCAATAVSLSSQWVAALVSESEQGTDLNGDGKLDDTVVHVHALTDPAPATCKDWRNIGEEADAVELCGSAAVFITSEEMADADLNGDLDQNDRVLQLFDLDSRILVNVGQAAEEFVCSDGLIAFRTRESPQGTGRGRRSVATADLNRDGDADDDVLRVYDLTTRRLINTRQAVTPCRLDACDPRIPYRVGNDTVTFLTLECDQGGEVTKGCPAGGQDLNGDGDAGDLVLQVFNVRVAAGSSSEGSGADGGGSVQYARTALFNTGIQAASLTVLAAASSGICTVTGEVCVSDATCGSGTCFVPPGGCLRTVSICDPRVERPCGKQPHVFCEPEIGSPGNGTCKELLFGDGKPIACASTADCDSVFPGSICNNIGQSTNRLVSPISAASRRAVGVKVFTSAGRCIEDIGETCEPGDSSAERRCDGGAFCEGNGVDNRSGQCKRDHGVCADDHDCPGGSRCRQDLLVAAADDVDGDEIPDPFDNCPNRGNILQEDTDTDGVGDACDRDQAESPTPTDPPIQTPTPRENLTNTPAATDTPTDPRTPTHTPTFTDTPTETPTPSSSCDGDCDRDRTVTIDELLRGVRIALGRQSAESCRPVDSNGDGQVVVAELVRAVKSALSGCRT